MSNKATGTQFERELASILAQYSFWVHIFQDNHNGQPCDVIAARNGHTYLFDCKDCQGNFFRLDRMEENQCSAMKLFELTGNGSGKFVVRFYPAEIYLVSYWQLMALRDKGYKRVDRMDCRMYGQELYHWLAERNKIDGWSEEQCKS